MSYLADSSIDGPGIRRLSLLEIHHTERPEDKVIGIWARKDGKDLQAQNAGATAQQ